MAGGWDFPGVQGADNVSDVQALARELREELGVDARPDVEIMTLTHDYPDRTVDLVLWRVTLLSGELFRIEADGIRQIEAVSLEVPYGMRSFVAVSP